MRADGVNSLPNADSGIEINGLSLRNRVGGTAAAERNIVSGNDGIGVQLLGSVQTDGSCEAPEWNLIQGNYLGVNVNGARPGRYGNLGEGAQMSVCARNNTIGGSAAGARNIISGNRADGVELDASTGPGGALGVCNNVIQGNYIGSDPTGMIAVPNVDDGIGLDNGVCNTLIGGSNPGEGNLISGSFNDGIDVSRPGSNGNVIRGNLIGLSADGNTVLRNGQSGVHLRFKASSTLIEGNVISANVGHGILIEHNGTNSSIVRGNKIGSDAGGTIARGNKLHGIGIVDGPRFTTIEQNTILGNTQDGVAVERVSSSANLTRDNRIRENVIRSNGGLAIDLLPSDGVNGNDGNNANGAVGNLGIDFPVIQEATSVAARGTAPPGATVEVFRTDGDASGHGELSAFVGSATADAAGAWCLGGVSISGSVTATATDSAGNSSEASPNVGAAGTASLCGGAPPPSGTVLFVDDFIGPDGSAPSSAWEVRRSASGAGAGAFIRSNHLELDVLLSSAQQNTWQYVQSRVVPVQPSWASGTMVFDWKASTDAGSSQSSSFVLAPSAATGNVLSLGDYLRVRVQNGAVSVVRRVGAGPAATIWSGPVAMGADLRNFQLRLTASSLTLIEGPAGSEQVRVSNLAHGLGWTTAHVYLHGSTNSTSPFIARFDAVRITALP